MPRQLLVIAALALLPLAAGAAIPDTLYSAANCSENSTPPLDYVFCDDGLPASGGTTANEGAALAIPVPARYEWPTDGNTYRGLPPIAGDAGTLPGADSAGTVGIDADVSIPRSPPPAGGYPLLIIQHGCCSGNKTSWESNNFVGDANSAKNKLWHYNNAWWASRGYVVLNFTGRGFVNSSNRGSTGEFHLNSRSYVVNDLQHMACQLLAGASNFTGVGGAGGGGTVAINPDKVVITGGSNSGGITWTTITDPIWDCTEDTGTTERMKLVAAAPRYGWTDIVHALVPTGRHIPEGPVLPDFEGCDSSPNKFDGSACPDPRTPVGIPKMSIDAGLYATGINQSGNHTTFPDEIHDALLCLQSNYPSENNPICLQGARGTRPIAETLPLFLRESSAYYQNDWFANIATDPEYRVPIFSVATLTDALFPSSEHRRMHARILSMVPDYPLQVHFGDHQHFTQDKAKEWGDVCGTDRHLCNDDDYLVADGQWDFNAPPTALRRMGIHSRLNRFIDHYAKPAGNATQPKPAFDVTMSMQMCPTLASEMFLPPDESHDIFVADSYVGMRTGTFVVSSNTPQQTSPAVSDPFNAQADPVANDQGNGGSCMVRSSGSPAPGIAVYNSDVLAEDVLMVGAPTITMTFTTTDQTNPLSGVNALQLNGRLFDVFPNGSAVLVDRGPRRITPTEAVAGQVTFELHGNAWRFRAGHRIRLEILQDDDPFLQDSEGSGNATISTLSLSIPRRIPQSRTADAVSTPVETTADPGAEDVAAGSFTLVGSGDRAHTVESITVTVEHPELLSSLTLTVDTQTITFESVEETMEILLDPAVQVRPGWSTPFALTADVADASTAAGSTGISVAWAAAGIRRGTVNWGLLLVAATTCLGFFFRQHRLSLPAIALGLLLASCNGGGGGGNGGGGGGGPPPPPAENVARLTLSGIASTVDDGAAGNYADLPLVIGNVEVNLPAN